jgi:hypothetical protein
VRSRHTTSPRASSGGRLPAASTTASRCPGAHEDDEIAEEWRLFYVGITELRPEISTNGEFPSRFLGAIAPPTIRRAGNRRRSRLRGKGLPEWAIQRSVDRSWKPW